MPQKILLEYVFIYVLISINLFYYRVAFCHHICIHINKHKYYKM